MLVAVVLTLLALWLAALGVRRASRRSVPAIIPPAPTGRGAWRARPIGHRAGHRRPGVLPARPARGRLHTGSSAQLRCRGRHHLAVRAGGPVGAVTGAARQHPFPRPVRAGRPRRGLPRSRRGIAQLLSGQGLESALAVGVLAAWILAAAPLGASSPVGATVVLLGVLAIYLVDGVVARPLRSRRPWPDDGRRHAGRPWGGQRLPARPSPT